MKINARNCGKYKLGPLFFLSFCVFLTFVTIANYAGWSKNIFYGDALGYYTYLPALFRYHAIQDLLLMSDINNLPTEIVQGITQWQYQYPVNDQGKVIIQYTYGVALVQSPFYLIAELLSLIKGGELSAFSSIHIILIRISSWIYTYCGLLFLYFSMTKYVTKAFAIFGTASVFFGSNLLWFGTYQAGMVHAYSFFFVAMLIWSMIQYLQNSKSSYLVLVATACAFISLLRPTDIVFAIIPIMGIYSVKGWSRKALRGWLTFGALCFVMHLLLWMPQFIYWKMMTGDFLFYSYKDQGFNWTSPQIFKGLFGPNNGWVTYTPATIVWILVSFFCNNKLWKISSILLTIALVYINYSWWNYYYINGFGSRPMIHLYPLLGLAFVIGLSKLKSYKFLFYTVLSLTICATTVSMIYTFKSLKGTLVSESSTHIFNINTLFKNNLNVSDLVYRDIAVSQNLNTPLEVIQDTTLTDEENIHYIEYSATQLSFTLDESMLASSQLHITGQFMATEVVYMDYDQATLVVDISRDGQNIAWYGVKINNKIGKEANDDVIIQEFVLNKWGSVSYVIPTNSLRPGDIVKAFVWNPSRRPLLLRSISISGSPR